MLVSTLCSCVAHCKQQLRGKYNTIMHYANHMDAIIDVINSQSDNETSMEITADYY